MKAEFRKAASYADDAMNLPVENVEAAIPFYTSVMGFRLVSREQSPMQRAVLARDDIQIGLAENGGDPTQEGCFFEVDNAEAAFEELESNASQTKRQIFASIITVRDRSRFSLSLRRMVCAIA